MSSLKQHPGEAPIAKSGPQSVKKLLTKKRILETFYKEEKKTIAELCETTNSSIPSITAIMHELMAEGWVSQFGTGESKGGRRPAMFDLNPEGGLIAGIDLSRKYSRLGVFNLHNEEVCDVLELGEGLETTGNILELLKEAFVALWAKHGIDKRSILGLGVTIPGLIDIRSGVSYSYDLFEGRRLSDVFEDVFGLPTVIEHDTKAMAVGESWFGLARDKSNVLFINIGSGIGLGIIIDNVLYHGHSGFCGEFGHIQMDPEGALCYCGKIGCLETIASGTALVKKSREMIEAGKSSIISQLMEKQGGKLKLATIIEAAKLGDLFAIELIEGAGEELAKGMAVLIHLFNPEAIIIGGEMAEAGNLITDPVKQKLNKYTMLRLKQDTKIWLSALKEKAGLYGTLPLVFKHTLDRKYGNGPGSC